MNDDRPDHLSMLIGLHKLAAWNGEGLVPELHDLIAERRRYEDTNVVPFPAYRARRANEGGQHLSGVCMGTLLLFPSMLASDRKRKESA